MITKTKKLGRPATGRGELIGVRIQPDLLAKLDAFIRDEYPELSRPEAIRSILTATLGMMEKGREE